jgi:hypothetical protein
MGFSGVRFMLLYSYLGGTYIHIDAIRHHCSSIKNFLETRPMNGLQVLELWIMLCVSHLGHSSEFSNTRLPFLVLLYDFIILSTFVTSPAPSYDIYTSAFPISLSQAHVQ